MRVYKFVNALHGISNLSLQRLRVSRFNELNDPFELLAVDLLDSKHRRALLKFKQTMDAQHGLLCFSKDWRNPLLWGHYGDSHKGMALGFDIPDDLLFEVKYTQARSKAKFNARTGMLIQGEQLLENLIRTKFSDWGYEEEYRLVERLDDHTQEGGSYFCSFSERLQPREVILGFRCDLSVDTVRGLLKNDFGVASVKKTKLALKKFRVVEDRTARIRTS